jgi:hypothetical protein
MSGCGCDHTCYDEVKQTDKIKDQAQKEWHSLYSYLQDSVYTNKFMPGEGTLALAERMLRELEFVVKNEKLPSLSK